MSSLRSLCSGLLLLPAKPTATDSCRLKAACSAINYRLFIDLVDSTGNVFQIMGLAQLNDRLQQLYSEAFSIAPHLDVRILLPPVPAAAAASMQSQPSAQHGSPAFESYHMNRGYGSPVSVYESTMCSAVCLTIACIMSCTIVHFFDDLHVLGTLEVGVRLKTWSSTPCPSAAARWVCLRCYDRSCCRAQSCI